MGCNPSSFLPKMAGDEVCVLPYSSGTTGRPKGVRVRSSSLLANIEMYNNENFSLHLDEGTQRLS